MFSVRQQWTDEQLEGLAAEISDLETQANAYRLIPLPEALKAKLGAEIADKRRLLAYLREHGGDATGWTG